MNVKLEHQHALCQGDYNALYKLLSTLNNHNDMKDLLCDLCTPNELEALASRWVVVQLLQEGLTYREIHEQCGASLATITRVARSLKHGTGGYQSAYNHMKASSS